MSSGSRGHGRHGRRTNRKNPEKSISKNLNSSKQPSLDNEQWEDVASIVTSPSSARTPPVGTIIGASPPPTRAPLAKNLTIFDAPLLGADGASGPEGASITPHGAQIAMPKQPEKSYMTEQLANALYDFTAENPSDLTVREGETLILIREEDENWWTLRNMRGEEGIVPRIYIELQDTCLQPEDDDDSAGAPISVPDTASLLSTIVMSQLSPRSSELRDVSPGLQFLGLETGYTASFSKVDKETISVQSQSIEEGLKHLRETDLLEGREEDDILPILEVGQDLNMEVSELENQMSNATDPNSNFLNKARKTFNGLREYLELIHLPHVRDDPSHQKDLEKQLSTLASLARVLFLSPETTTKDSRDYFRLSKHCLLVATSYLPEDHEIKSIVASHWGTLYFRRFQFFRENEHITQAIIFHQQSIDAVHALENYPKQALFLGSLGRSYLARFEDSQLAGDLKCGIEFSSQAWRAIQTNSAAASVEDKNVVIQGTSSGIQCFIEHVGGSNSLDLINSGIMEWRNTLLGHFTDDQTDRLLKAGCMRILGFLYSTRSSQLGRHDQVDSDIKKSRIFLSAAVALLPESHQDFISTLCLFARSLASSAGNKVKPYPDLARKSLELAERFTHLAPHSKASLWVSFGDFHMSLWHQGVNSVPPGSNLTEAIKYYERTLKEGSYCRPGSRLWAKARQKLGLCKLDEYKNLKKLGNQYDLEAEKKFKEALHHFIHIALYPAGHLFDRFTAACSWATSAASHPTFQTQALYGYETALELIPLIACFGGVPDQRRKATQKCGQLAAEAAATAIKMGKHSLALTLLERGRSVKWNHMLQLQSPLYMLKLHPGGEPLANRLEVILKNLQLGEHSSSEETTKQASHDSVDLQEQYQQVLDEIRKMKHFANFMRPKIFEDLVKAAGDWLAVVINVHEFRSDALIVKAGGNSIKSVRLDKLSPDCVIKMRKSIDQSLKKISNSHVNPTKENGGTKQLEIELKNLWSWVVKPILETLKNEPRDSKGLLRITWCPTGPLSFFPLHAAGDYRSLSERTYKHVISSYSPTLSALVPDSWQDKEDKDHEILLVNPGDSARGEALPSAKVELDCIVRHFTMATGSLGERLAKKKYFDWKPANESNSSNSSQAQIIPQFCLDMDGVSDEESGDGLSIRIPRKATGTGDLQNVIKTSRYTRLEGQKASPKKVYEEMQNHSSVHFACHTQHSDDPARYGFVLAGGLLSLQKIAQMRYERRGLAFLSACGTAEGDQNLPDEAVHLASGMLMTGYSSVIATLWPVKDNDAPFVANLVYRRLMVNGKFEYRWSAVALHEALDKLRDEPGVRLPDWISFVHFGGFL